MNLILSGGGSGKQTVRVNTLFTSLLKNKDIMYIPIAIDKVKHPYDSCLEWIKGELGEYGDFNITLFKEEDIKSISYDDIVKYGGIFIGGGNTFYLLKELRESKFDSKLVKLLSNTDIPVLGGSAGAAIFAKSIKTVELYDENIVNLKDLNGLNMMNGSNIWAHYEDSMEGLVKEYRDILKTDIICLREDEGLYITNMNEDGERMGEVRVIGLGYSD